MKALTVCCLKQGKKYGSEYVNILYNMVRRNLTLPHDFICHTDDDTGITPAVECYPIENGLTGWWGKINFYQERPLGVETDRILFLDLDMVITGSLDDLVRFPSHHAMIRDYPEGSLRPGDEKAKHGNSSVFLMTRGRMTKVYTLFFHELSRGRAGLSEQGFINKHFLNDVDLLPDWMAKSYKMHKLYDLEKPPENCRVVMFHGRPNPPDCGGWVKDYWK